MAADVSTLPTKGNGAMAVIPSEDSTTALDVARMLLEAGADPNIRDDGDNAYPIHFAAERGELPIVKLLIEHGADPIGAGTTHLLDVLGWAVCFNNITQLEVARYLLDHGARHTLLSAVAMGEVGAIRPSNGTELVIHPQPAPVDLSA